MANERLTVNADSLSLADRNEFDRAYHEHRPVRYEGRCWLIRSRPTQFPSAGALTSYQLVEVALADCS